jgi:ferredoxin
MRLRYLKPFRVIFSLLTFFLILYVFVDFTGKLSHELIRGSVILQFVPSALQFFHLFTAAALGFLFVIVLTLLFGRVYCSFLCPLGTLQDLFTRTASFFRRKKRARYSKPNTILQNSLLILSLILVFSGSLVLVNLLDPYSLAGRIFSDLVRPVYYGANNILAWILKTFNNYYLYPVEVKYISWSSVIISLFILISIGLLAFFRGRWYCNAICPVGTILGHLSRVSLLKVRIDESGCTSCGLCARVCKAECIDFKEKRVDFERCVACYNCFGACSNNGFSYSTGIRKERTEAEPDLSRRNFIRTTATSTISLAGLTMGLPGNAAETKTGSSEPVTPPGSGNVWRFTSLCTACHLCVSVCPTKVLQPSLLEYGLAGILQPRMNFRAAFCNFDCVACTTICPTEAIQSLTVEQKHRVQTGVSKFIEKKCVVVEKGTACGACSEHCPTKAVEMVPYKGTLKIPRVDEKICVGCGACEFACPTRPVRAIYVESNRYHRTAMIPLKKVDEAPEIKKVTEDFPF